MSCSSRAIRARSATTACVRSISASRAVCAAASRAASAEVRWVRTLTPVRAGMKETSPMTRPINSASGLRNQARKPIVDATVIRSVATGRRRAAAGVPYSTAAYMTSVNIRMVARLPQVNWSATSASVPTVSAVCGAVRRSSSAAAMALSGTRVTQAAEKEWPPWVWRPSSHSSSPPSSPETARDTASRSGRIEVSTTPSNTHRRPRTSLRGSIRDYIEGCSPVSSLPTTCPRPAAGRLEGNGRRES